MKFVLACHGTRGDVEPCAAVGRELLHRGHDVRMAVPPDLVGFAESAGLAAVAYGLDTQVRLDAHRNFWRDLFGLLEDPDLIWVWRESWEPNSQSWGEMSKTLTSLAGGGRPDIHRHGFRWCRCQCRGVSRHSVGHAGSRPAAGNGQFLPFLPAPLGRSTMTVTEWLVWRVWKKAEDANAVNWACRRPQAPRQDGSPNADHWKSRPTTSSPSRAGAEWAKWNGQRPFVGALTMELPTDADEDIASWIAAGTPPIYFGFGSIPVESPADTVAMIGAGCAELGERASVCSGWSVSATSPISSTSRWWAQ